MNPGIRPTDTTPKETTAIAARYARRDAQRDAKLYNSLNPAVYLSSQERERALIQLIHTARLPPVSDKTVLEVGCGTGRNLLQLIGLGFHPANLVGSELIDERVAVARHCLPTAVEIHPGNALDLIFENESFDVVLQSTVFSSLLDREFRTQLALKMWQWVKPGGGIVWYDFTFDNPRNPDVKGISLSEIRRLFPEAGVLHWRVTLAPPISRVVTQIHPVLYALFNIVPLLRTHLLCWIEKQP